MGPWAYRFADFLAETKQRFWQCLPLNPTDLEYFNSPYHSISAFACNPLLLSPEFLFQQGFLGRYKPEPLPQLNEALVDYPCVVEFKNEVFGKAYQQFKRAPRPDDFILFCERQSWWLDDFALFMALKAHHGGSVWTSWSQELRDRDTRALQSAKAELQEECEKQKLLQYLFFRQWFALKAHCNQRGIKIIGDMPIYVVHDSAEVWVHPELFYLDHESMPSVVAGVPPDYFSETGQLWGNPVYRWDVLMQTGYHWWMKRVGHNLGLFDLLRVDHFRGFIAFWEIPARERTAINGRWVTAPGKDFFQFLSREFPHPPIIAEDLGIITNDVWEVMNHFGFPGMKVLLFAFGEGLPTNPYAPHNHVKNCVVYTGTHDNNTVRGWFENEASPEDRRRLSQYLGREVSAEDVHLEFARLAMMSVADMAIIPMQDILGLAEGARMNRPAKKPGNWRWRLLHGQLTDSIKKQIREMTEIYGRAIG
jgi:4-alpha-glucanotransferase